jgi:glycerol-1-phosphate dehydrogenase [NAD(P)+]
VLLVPVHVIAQAPRRTFVSGIADVLANLVACEDWAWAARVRGEPFDDYAALLARTAAELVTAREAAFARSEQPEPADVETLLRALVLSGLAMTVAGSSRPCSGPEHLISHAFDELSVGHGTHGEQVGVGSTLAVRFYDHGVASVVDVLERVGAPTSPLQIGIERDDALRAVAISHRVRPGRHTRLSAALDADPDFVREVAEEAWYA